MIASKLNAWMLPCVVAAALGVAGPAAAEDAAAPPPATRVVEALHAALLEVMQEAETLGYDGRFDKLAPVLDRAFDIQFMAEKSVGRHWKDASESERERLLETFTRFTVANYAGRFDGYSGQSFETLRQEPSTHGTVVVYTRLDDPGGDDVLLNYRLRPTGDSWKIVDVYLNGTVSEIALRRSEYSSLIRREGFEALLNALQERIGDLASGHVDRT